MSTEPSLVGQVISSYRIEALLGSGGMGQVYRGTHVHLRRSVAIKIMRAELAGDPTFQERFLREARTAASLNHANIVHVYDFGVQDGRAFLVMELVPDGSIATLQKAGPLDLIVGLDLVRQAAWGLAFAHERGVVHRDIKPDNLLLAPRTPPAPHLAPYTLKIADFGLVRLLDGGPLTQSGISMGTPAYMSPEQCQGHNVDQRSDIYSLGIVLYEVATGTRPFNVRNLTDATYQHVHVEPPPARQVAPDLSPDIQQVIDKCLAKQPSERFQQSRTLAAAIDAVIAEETGRRRSGILPNVAAAAPIAAAAVSLGLAPAGPAVNVVGGPSVAGISGGPGAAGLSSGPGAGGIPGGPSGGLGGGPNAGGIAGGPASPPNAGGIPGGPSSPLPHGPSAGGTPGAPSGGVVGGGPNAGGMPAGPGEGVVGGFPGGPSAGGLPGVPDPGAPGVGGLSGGPASPAAPGPGLGGMPGKPPPSSAESPWSQSPINQPQVGQPPDVPLPSGNYGGSADPRLGGHNPAVGNPAMPARGDAIRSPSTGRFDAIRADAAARWNASHTQARRRRWSAWQGHVRGRSTRRGCPDRRWRLAERRWPRRG